MRWAKAFTARLRSLFRRARVEREMDAELQFHVDQEIAEHLARGMSPAEARAAALRAVGDVTRVKEDCRQSLGLRLLDELRQDARYGARSFLKTPGFTVVAVLPLTLVIAATATVFPLLDALIFKPLPVSSPDELVTLYEQGPEGPADTDAGTGR